LPITDPRTRKAVRELSEKIGAAIFSTPTGVPRIAPNERTRDFDLENASRNIQNQQVKKGLGKEKSPRRILWVDDRPNNNITERKALEAYNITFDLAKSTGEALALLRNNHFDAINK